MSRLGKILLLLFLFSPLILTREGDTQIGPPLPGHLLRNESINLPRERFLDFIGSGVNCVDDPTTQSTKCTINSTGDALTTNPLSQFAATTSAQFAGVISDETGTGLVTLATGPTLTSPLISDIVSASNFTLTQGGVIPFTSVASSAVANTLYLLSGKVGIGTATPGAFLDVSGGAIRVTGGTTPTYPSVGQGLEIVFDSDSGVNGGTAGSTIFQSYSRDTSTWRDLWFRALGFQFDASGGMAMIISSAGAVGINTATPTFKLDTTGNVRHTSLTAAAATKNSVCIDAATKEVMENAASSCLVSSARFKNDITPQGVSLPLLMQLKPSQFAMNDTGEKRLGLIAEDIMKIESRLVDLDTGKLPYSVRYQELVSVVIKGIQEQQDTITNLTKRIEQLETLLKVVR